MNPTPDSADPATATSLADQLDALRQLSPDDRARVLREWAVNQPERAAELEALLHADAAAGERVEKVFQRAHASAADALSRARAGLRIGPWLVFEEIGAGGMGSVHRAERADGAYRAQVAIKFLRGFPDQAALARFAQERQVLATLRHPHIATLLDGGTTGDGQPYLVMALIDGVALDIFCSSRNLSIKQRIGLIQQVCEGVDHAHQHLIVHRDLKPSNVLVDATGHAYVTDFGIARVLDQPEVSGASRAMFTPGYASPEQRAGAPVGIGSDIYSLGRVLACVLEGCRIERDLARIVAVATDESPERRYRSALALKEDLARYLAHQPVHARAPTWRYRFSKLLRRHPLAALATLLVVAALVGFGVELKRERDRAQIAEVQAQQRAELAQQTTRYLVGLFRNADPAQARGQTLSVRELLDRGYQDLAESEIANAPVRAELYATFGSIYQTIGLPQPALTSLTEALALLPENDALARAPLLERRSLLLLGNNEIDAALDDAQLALALYRTHLRSPSVEEISAQISVSKPLQSLGRFDEAEAMLLQALRASAQFPERPELKGDALTFLGVLATRTNKLALARERLTQALTIQRDTFGAAHPQTLDVMQALSNLLLRMGDLAAMDAMTQALVAGRKQVHGEDSSSYWQAQLIRNSFLLHTGALIEADALSRATIAAFARIHPEPVLEDSTAYQNLSLVLEDRGALAESSRWLARCIAARDTQPDPPSVHLLSARLQRARLWLRQGELTSALTEAEVVLKIRRESLGAEHFDTVETELLAAVIRAAKTRDPSVLDGIYAERLPAMVQARGEQSPPTLRAVILLAEFDPDDQRALKLITTWAPQMVTNPYADALLALLRVRRLQAIGGPTAQTALPDALTQLRQRATTLRTTQVSDSPRLFELERALR